MDELTVRVGLGGTGDHNTRSSTSGSTSTGTDVAEKLLKGDRLLCRDEGVNRPLQDVPMPPGTRPLRVAEDSLEGIDSDEEKGREGMHDRVGEIGGVDGRDVEPNTVEDLHGVYIYLYKMPVYKRSQWIASSELWALPWMPELYSFPMGQGARSCGGLTQG